MALYSRGGEENRALKGYWKFEDFRGDSAPTKSKDEFNKNNGVFAGNPSSTTDINNKKSNAIFFDGTGDWSDISSFSSVIMGNTDTTISCWGNFTPSQTGFIYDSTNQLSLYMDNGTPIAYINSNLVDEIITGDFATGRWMHLAIVFSRSKQKVTYYINGRLHKTGTTISAFGVASNNRIMAQSDGTDDLRAGLKNFRIYRRALNQAEVNRLYHTRK